MPDINHAITGAHEETLAAVPFTCRLTAAYRWIEHTRATDPILRDDLAQHLAGSKALALATNEWAALQAEQGTDKHFRVPARSRIIDDVLLSLISTDASHPGAPAAAATAPAAATLAAASPPPPPPSPPAAAVQVVCLGAGMDTRPWRLPLGPHVSYFEVDHSDVTHLKTTLLLSAGAQTTLSPPTSPAPQPTPSSPPPRQPTYPLRCGTWATCGADLTSANLAQILQSVGFTRAIPTIWIAEGLIYYLPLPESTAMLQAIGGLSAPGSFLLTTCIDRVLWETHKTAKHVFANLWHFCVDQVVVDNRIVGTPWVVRESPKATSVLLRERYGQEVYRPLVYDGNEEFFVAAVE